ncbi:MAG TPA: response regulator [Polyangia bacterium]|jgi:CheY-like chemotaxis protein|nr:response regulator [Polyangia bacterium]
MALSTDSAPSDAVRRTVLVVEDDRDVQEALASILEDAGYDVLCAGNGREALRRLHDCEGRCNLILLDLMMPVMNGWDFRHRQRQTPAFAGIPVFLMSAGAHLAVVREELQATGSVAKPVDAAEILDIVDRHCS